MQAFEAPTDAQQAPPFVARHVIEGKGGHGGQRQEQAVLRPGTREEVQTCVRVANRARVPLYPISSGRNWGYGSRAPVSDAVLLDLSRLNRIREFNEQLAYVTVEPA